jgi:hypothetical protein
MAFRKYDEAVDRLRNIRDALDDPKVRTETLDKIQIAHTREMLPNVAVVARAIGDLIRSDMPTYIDRLIAKAQDDVREADTALQDALARDRKSKLMCSVKYV